MACSRALLRAGPLLRLRHLVEDLELGGLVLEHPLLGRNPRSEIERRLLIGRAAQRTDQLLERGESVTRVGERRARSRLQHGGRGSGGGELRLLGR